MKKRLYRPERSYRFLGRVTEESLKAAFEANENVTGRIQEFDVVNQCLFVKLNKTTTGILPFSECFLEEVNNNCVHLPKPIEKLIRRKNIRVRILQWTDNKILLSRKESLLEVLNNAKKIIGKRGLFSIVENVTPTGVTCDFGEGLEAFCPLGQVSKTFINDASSWYKRGDIVKVVITDVDTDNFKVTCSIKQSDPCDFSKFLPGLQLNVKVGNPVYTEGMLTGYFVEVSPGICGIADLNSNFAKKCAGLKQGKIIRTQIKQVLPEERRIKLIIV